MTLNRMGSRRRSVTRKAWVTGTLALGVVVASGAVASAAHHPGTPTQKFKLSSESGEHSKGEGEKSGFQKSGSERSGNEKSGHEKSEGDFVRVPKGPVCLKLDSEAQKSIAEAGAGQKETVLVPLNKVELVPCQEAKPAPPKAAPPVAAPQPVAPAPAPVTTTAPAPAPAPVAPAPVPANTTVKSTAS